MRPLQLQLQGFTAFHDRVTVDFSGRRLFAITGPTGAGKSSLLDGMIWALYGRVPKVGLQVAQLISHGAHQARVQFEFEAHGHRYRIARVRPVTGTTTARLERMLPGGELLLADSVKDVNTQVEHILGIDYDTFVKTIVLPQGEFSAFLSGDPKEKKDVLRKLLGLEIYSSMMKAANIRASGAKSAADLLQQQHDQLDYRTSDDLAAIEAQLRDAEERQQQLVTYQDALKRLGTAASLHLTRAKDAATAAATFEQARAGAADAETAAVEARTSLESASAALARTAEELAALGYDPGAHQQARDRLAASEHLDAARAQLEAATVTVDRARAAEAAALDACRQAEAAAEVAESALATAARDLTGAASVALATAAALESDAAGATRAASEANRKSHEAELRTKQLQHLAETGHSLRRDLEATDAGAQRAVAAAAAAEVERVRAIDAETAAAEALARCQVALDTARVQDAAAAILATLAIGDPCPVCGEPITDLKQHAAPDLEAATRAVEAAAAALDRARKSAGDAGNEAAAAHARAAEARKALDTVLAHRAAHEETLNAAGVTPTGVDRAAKRAASVAAAERERAADHELRAAGHTAEAQRLRTLLARLPHDLTTETQAATLATDVEAVARALAAAFDAYARSSTAASDARSEADRARAAAATTANEAKTEEALRDLHAGTVEEAASVLALAGGDAADLPTLRADLGALDRLAEQDAALRADLANHEQQQAASSAVLAVRETTARAADRAQAEAATAADTARQAASQACAEFEAEWRRQLPPNLQPDATAVPELIDAAGLKAMELAGEVGHAGATLEAARAQVDQAAKLLDDTRGYRRRSEVAGALGLELQANHFVAYIQREAMRILAADAGDRMLQLSRDRYRLEADGDEFVVVDRLNGDERRSVRTLSGGETFLASLALALALSERLPELSGHGGALALDSLFLDEGFGSLDAESLSVAIEGLELLASGSRMIGVISHVPEVAERLADRVEVVKVGSTSTIRDGR